ncbi:MAG: TIGR04149 family rSAM-modified RiPP [Prevotellaceae bacterium]|jgi:natural product precursor|nr:TIGR04149 family rSAM-modified RiPP [Prevotellaceae bacterium]
MNKNIKINNLNNCKLEKREMSKINGGRSCGCGCCGPSGADDNAIANYEGGANGMWPKDKDCLVIMTITDGEDPQ